MAGGEPWTERQRAYSRAEYQRLYATGHRIASTNVDVPDDVTILSRDPSPCFNCGTQADLPCRHQPWMAN